MAHNPSPTDCPATLTPPNPIVCPVNGSTADTKNPTLQFYGRGIKQNSYFYNAAGFSGQYVGKI
jgi:hypothetical protein